LLEAVAELKNQTGLPKFRVLVCGKGPLEPQLRRFTGQHGLSEVVEFVGFVSEADKPRYYASADIAVFPSSGGESFGIVLLEAMAGGRAVVLAGDNPGYRSVMAPRPDLLFDPRDPRALAAKLASYLSDRQQRQQMQIWEADYAKQFDVNVVGAKLLDIYRQVLRKKRGA
jgi:phosphatidylinositol alpha-mannosyltransferase